MIGSVAAVAGSRGGSRRWPRSRPSRASARPSAPGRTRLARDRLDRLRGRSRPRRRGSRACSSMRERDHAVDRVVLGEQHAQALRRARSGLAATRAARSSGARAAERPRATRAQQCRLARPAWSAPPRSAVVAASPSGRRPTTAGSAAARPGAGRPGSGARSRTPSISGICMSSTTRPNGSPSAARLAARRAPLAPLGGLRRSGSPRRRASRARSGGWWRCRRPPARAARAAAPRSPAAARIARRLCSNGSSTQKVLPARLALDADAAAHQLRPAAGRW